MKKLLISVPAAVLFMTMAATGAQAQTRTWVSGVGSDLNPCSRTAPCKTFAGALSKTAAGGEINCLDPAGYGAVTIAKNITIDCNWTHGSILAANTNGVIVNAAGIVVILRGLSINGANTTTGNGIRIINAAEVVVDDVVIEHFAGTGTNGRGIAIEKNGGSVRVDVHNTRIVNNGNVGILSQPTAANVSLNVTDTRISDSGTAGIILASGTNAVIDNSQVTAHGTVGIRIENTGSTLNLSRSLVAHNGIGLQNGIVGQAPNTILFGNIITANTTGVSIVGGNVFSYGNNGIRGNNSDGGPNQPVMNTQ